MSDLYAASDIEILSGLDPVRRRPGMYTDTARPNHLVQELVDNSVDEALDIAKRLLWCFMEMARCPSVMMSEGYPLICIQ